MTLLSCWMLITLLNFDTFLSRNSTGRRYVDGSEFHVELWPRVKIPRWIMDPGQNSTLNCDPNPRLQFNLGHNSTWNQDPVSQFNVESKPGVTIPREILIRVTIQSRIMTRGHNSTLSYDPGSQFNVELWHWIKIPRWIMTRAIVPHWNMIQIPGHNWTLNHDSGSQFNVELRPRVIIQRGIKTWGHNSTGGLNFIRRRCRNTMTPCLGVSQFNMKNPLNPEHSPLNQDPTGRNSMGSKFNPTPALYVYQLHICRGRQDLLGSWISYQNLRKMFHGIIELGWLLGAFKAQLEKMEKRIRARQWDRELNVLNTESFLWAENDIAHNFAKSSQVMEIPYKIWQIWLYFCWYGILFLYMLKHGLF